MAYYDDPNYTMVPNKLLDFDMADLTRSELTTLLYIVRHTMGFGKTMDAISFKQFMHGITRHDGTQLDRGTGIKNRTVLSAALISLEERGCITSDKRDHKAGDRDVTEYKLSVFTPGEREALAPAVGGTKNVPRSTKASRGGTETLLQVVTESYPQEKRPQEKEIQEKEHSADASASDAGASPPRKRRSKCDASPEEVEQRETFLSEFDRVMHSISGPDTGAYRAMALKAIRGYGYDEMMGCLRAMATSRRFVGKVTVNPTFIGKNVLVWEDAHSPRSWDDVERWAERKALRQAGR